jgi:hypothetical protein
VSKLRGFDRRQLVELRSGDDIQFNRLYQSRTGMIAREAVRGRITQLRLEEVPAGWRPSYLHVEVQDAYGALLFYTLTCKDAIYVDITSAGRLSVSNNQAGRTLRPLS